MSVEKTSRTSGAGIRDVFAHDTWVKPYFKKYRKQLVTALGLGLVMYAFAALLMFTSGYLICRTTEETNGVFMVMVPIALVQVFGIGKPLLRYLERLLSHDWVFRMTSSLRQRLYTIVEQHTTRLKASHQTGDFLGFIAEDIGHIQNLYLRSIFPLVIAWALYAAVVIALGIVSPGFALVVLLMIGTTVVLLPLVSVLANRARLERVKHAKNSLYTRLTDNVLGAADWVFAGRGKEYLERCKHDEDALRADARAVERYARINDLVATIIFGVLAIAIFAWATTRFGAAATGAGGPLNWVAAFVLGLFPLVEVFMPLPMAATQAYTHFDAVNQLNALPGCETTTDIEPEHEEDVQVFNQLKNGLKALASDDDQDLYQTDFDDYVIEEDHDDVAPDTANMALDIHDVTFAYDDQSKPVLQGLNLHIQAGSKVAILGRSGSGKSTLAKLIRGDEVPTSGWVRIGGVDTSALPASISRYVGVVQQQAYLFNRSLRDNLTLGVLSASDERLCDVLEAVGLGSLLQRLDDDLDTMMDEAGMRFSGGERHRIALARVLLSEAPIVLLDEPTVGLDPATEAALMDTLMNVLGNKTLIMITHHLQGVEQFDRVVFIEDGVIELDGTPAHLTQTSERYQKLLAFDRGLVAD